jgi:starvation-inducible DNA-binding protein
MKLHKTHNALDSNVKTTAIALLNARVADTIDLSLATKQAHWNLKGRQFIGVHEMLDQLRGDLDGYVDTMAERAVQLGGTALGTVQTTAKTSKLAPYPTDIFAVEAHLAAMIERTGTAANAVRESIDEADEAGDADTADIFTEVSRGLDKWLWFLEAHLEA